MKKEPKMVNGAGSLGAIIGIYYGVSKGKGFWHVAGYSILFALGGVALEKVYQSLKN